MKVVSRIKYNEIHRTLRKEIAFTICNTTAQNAVLLDIERRGELETELHDEVTEILVNKVGIVPEDETEAADNVIPVDFTTPVRRRHRPSAIATVAGAIVGGLMLFGSAGAVASPSTVDRLCQQVQWSWPCSEQTFRSP